jgi:phosphodiester glycosidase
MAVPPGIATAGTTELTEPFAGVRHFHHVLTVPREVDINIVEIDLSESGIDFRMTPAGPHASGETAKQTTRSFVQQQGAQVGINGSFSIYLSGQTIIKGIVASDGDVYSPFEWPPDEPWPVLNLSASNVASIHDRNSAGGIDVLPTVTLFNAVSGSERIVTNGVNTATVLGWGAPGTLQPRTAAGITADQKLLLVTVDGRNAGHSLGMNTAELANILIDYGAVDAISLDGGGSSTLVFADPTAGVVNVPVGTGAPGSERANTTNLAVFANQQTVLTGSRLTFADFQYDDEGTFASSPSHSGSTFGIDAAASTAVTVSNEGHESTTSQRLIIADDPGTPGGWFVRHVSGPGASREQNTIRPTDGFIGFWAKTSDTGVQATIAIDDTNNTTADRGIPKSLIADGDGHLYEWNLENNSHWEGWINGDGVIDTLDFTIDSIQLLSGDADAVVFLDSVSHYTEGSMGSIPLITGDINSDGFVGIADLNVMLGNWNQTVTRGDRSKGDIAGTGSGHIGLDDLNVLLSNWNAGAPPATPVPEPAALTFCALGVMIIIARR